jgi:hypothetical protein
MPRGNGRVLVVAAALVWAVGFGGTAKADPPTTLPILPPTAPVVPPTAPTVAPAPPTDSAHPTIPGVKDLTPPGFADPGHGEKGHGGDAHGGGHGGGGHGGGHGTGHPEVPGHLLPSVPEEGGWYTAVDFLLLRPRRGGFDYAIPSTAGGLTTSGPVQSLNYELRTGVRAELGYRLGHSHWELLAGYTYFRSNGFDAVFAAPGQAILPTLTRPGLTDTVAFAGADANLEYHVYDALVARRFAVDEHVALRMLGGMRFASIRQGFNAYYDGIDARAASVRTRSDFEGFGPVIGGEAVWAGWNGFHLYAKANGGLLTGTSENPILEANGNGGAVFVNSGYDVRKVVPFTTVGVGGGWQYRTFSLRAGYEITHWFGLTDQPRFTDDVGRGKFVPTQGDLSLEGLFVQAAVQF